MIINKYMKEVVEYNCTKCFNLIEHFDDKHKYCLHCGELFNTLSVEYSSLVEHLYENKQSVFLSIGGARAWYTYENMNTIVGEDLRNSQWVMLFKGCSEFSKNKDLTIHLSNRDGIQVSGSIYHAGEYEKFCFIVCRIRRVGNVIKLISGSSEHKLQFNLK